jgi:curved DNA-binding protein
MNPYDVLGVSHNADADEIKRAFRERAKGVHPDQNPDDSQSVQRFVELRAAFECLEDPESRAEIDRDLAPPQSEEPPLPPPSPTIVDHLSNLSGKLRGVAKKVVGLGGDLDVDLRIVFSQAALGSKARVEVDGAVIEFDVPAGVASGQRLKLKGHGEPNAAGESPGDLFVMIHYDPHPLLEQRGSDLHCTVPISMFEAATGTQIEIPTLTGIERLEIPPGTQPGDRLKLTGRGIATDSGTSGDQIIAIVVEVPDAIGRAGQAKVRELAKELNSAEYPRRAAYLKTLGEVE